MDVMKRYQAKGCSCNISVLRLKPETSEILWNHLFSRVYHLNFLDQWYFNCLDKAGEISKLLGADWKPPNFLRFFYHRHNHGLWFSTITFVLILAIQIQMQQLCLAKQMSHRPLLSIWMCNHFFGNHFSTSVYNQILIWLLWRAGAKSVLWMSVWI